MQFVQPILWDDAIDKIGDKSAIGSALDTEAWWRLPLALRERAFFSSTIENVRFLQRARDSVTDYLSSAVETLPNGETALATGSRSQFIKQMQDFAIAEGMGPLDAADAGTLKDITSEGRLGLIFDVNTQAAEDYGNWKQGQDPDVLNEFPAQRFLRVRDVKTPRTVHQQNDGVVRLKSDLGFWMAMNDPVFGGFGVPWGPWGFNSGMGVADEDRDYAEQAGLLDPGEQVKPIARDFNSRLQASTHGLDPDMKSLLKRSFGDQVQFDDKEDTVNWVESQPPPKQISPISPISQTPPAVPGTPAPAPTPGTPTTLDDILKSLNLDGPGPATKDDMTALRDALKETNPTPETRVVKSIKGAQPAGALTDANIRAKVQEFLNFVPPAKVAQLPVLNIAVSKASGSVGTYTMGGNMEFSHALLAHDDTRFKRNAFHELTHWLHRQGDQKWRDEIKKHFDTRTKGEKVCALPGYRGARGKKDKWYEPYAGKVYSFEGANPEGLEVPTRYMEWLTMEPAEMARLWNDPDFRETIKIVLKGLF